THGPRMLDPAATPAAARLTVSGDKLVVEVPQHFASALQCYLRNNAIGTTLFLDQVAGDACLVLRDPANAGRVHALLTRWKPGAHNRAARPSPPGRAPGQPDF